ARAGARYGGSSALLVTPLRRMHVLERQQLLVQFRRLAFPRVFPGRDKGEVLVVAQSLAVRRLVLLAEVGAAGFVAAERIGAHQLGQFEEIGHTPRLFKRLVDLFSSAVDLDVPPIFGAQLPNLADRLRETGGVARHATVVPYQLAKLAVERVHRACSLGFEQGTRTAGNVLSRRR